MPSQSLSKHTTSQELRGLLITMRPKQWSKNTIIFAALVFDGKLLHPFLLAKTTAAFAIFCLISSTVYLINDLVDIEKDRAHPSKCHRPLASGQLHPRTALSAAIAIPLIFLPLSFLLGTAFGAITTTYLGMMIAYSFVLKNVVIIDVLTIAGGFVMRVAAGTVIFHVERFSPWLYVCTTLLALFLGLSKRRQELVLLNQDADNHRAALQDYSIPFLDEMIALVTSTTVMAYSLYTFSAPNLPRNHTMMLTIPFVLYGLFRYLYLIHVRGEVKAPDELLLKDRALSLSVAFWGMASVIILYWAPQ
ncbi:MAG: decaprenyl-phosphate phosphoribosyltransferase [Chloroflexi bacterium]|nr:decaprenyl-phosphate phosphoribosyltransferase [Chloroflexota bacterium]